MTIPSPADDSAASKCIECGAEITPTAKFCFECGVVQTSQAVEAAVRSVPSEVPSLNSEVMRQNSDNESLHQAPLPGSLFSHWLFRLRTAVAVIALVSVGSWAWVA